MSRLEQYEKIQILVIGASKFFFKLFCCSVCSEREDILNFSKNLFYEDFEAKAYFYSSSHGKG
jgi:hypothetical protein